MTAACGGSAGNSNNGTIHGLGFKPVDAMVVFHSSAPSGALTINDAFVVLSSEAGICSRAQRNAYSSGETGLILDLSAINQELKATAYPLEASGSLVGSSVAFRRDLSSSCQGPGASDAVGSSGTVTVDALDSAGARGSYDLLLDSGDRITGTFDAGFCGSGPAVCL